MIGAPIIRVTDLILRNIFSFDEWPVVFPFLDAEERSTIVLENVIVEMDTVRATDNDTLARMVKLIQNRKRPAGLGSGDQNLTVWHPEDCKAHLMQYEKCKTRRPPAFPFSAIIVWCREMSQRGQVSVWGDFH